MSFFSHWFPRKSTPQQKHNRPTKRLATRRNRLNLESLESRRMLAITATFTTGTLAFVGDAGNDALTVTVTAAGATGLTVSYSGTGLATTTQATVTAITFNGGGGTNSLSLIDAVGIDTTTFAQQVLTVMGNSINYADSAGDPAITTTLTGVQTLGVFDNSVNGVDEIAVQSTTAATTVGSQSGGGET